MQAGDISLSHRDAQQEEYECIYRDWLDSMSESERKDMERRGLLEPESNIRQINGKSRSVEDMTFLEEPEKPNPAFREATDFVVRVLLEISESKNMALVVDAFLSALGLYSLEGATCADLGKKHGVSKQRFSIVRREIIDRFGLPPAPGGRTKQNRAKKRNES